MCILSVKPKEKISPRDIIKWKQIVWDEAGESISIKGIKGKVLIAGIVDTNSMDGLFDYGHNVLLISDFDKTELEVGDIIVYATTTNDVGMIIHRIVEKGVDGEGIWYKCKGDNNFKKDPYVLREVNILYLCIGIIY